MLFFAVIRLPKNERFFVDQCLITDPELLDTARENAQKWHVFFGITTPPEMVPCHLSKEKFGQYKPRGTVTYLESSDALCARNSEAAALKLG